MRIKIQETAISDFAHNFEQLSHIQNRFCNLLDLDFNITSQLEKQAKFRPSIKKPGIRVNVKFSDIIPALTIDYYQQIIIDYIQGIGWDDLQYVGFIQKSNVVVEIDIIFNRIISQNRVISLRCLGANWQQYQIIRDSYSNILQSLSPNSLCLMNAL
ncbi:hypothetical protein [Nodularia chucula]|uniref:hypothetical protein n=1 Tax=Nodularia chucula TaxID=3093667 RepID=UPI0039C62316